MSPDGTIESRLKSDCANCFALCCVALPYVSSADFALDKAGGEPCRHLNADFRCQIHSKLRGRGFKGCTVYDCFGAGQKVSQRIYDGKDWRQHPETAGEMFRVFPIMQQLHEMMAYLHEAAGRAEALSIRHELLAALKETERLSMLESQALLRLDVPTHRADVSRLLRQASKLVRKGADRRRKSRQKQQRRSDWVGAKARGKDLRGEDLRSTLLIAADLRDADLRKADFLGADLRDTDLSGADLTGSVFLTQVQVNAATGDSNTKLPEGLAMPVHWKVIN